MKICYICPKFYPRAVALYEYTQGLARMGCDVKVIAFRGKGEPECEKVGAVTVVRVTADSTSRGDRFRPVFLRFLWDAYQIFTQETGWDLVNMRNLPFASLFPFWARAHDPVWVLEIQSPPLHDKWRSFFSRYRMRLESKAFTHTLVHAEAVAYDIFGNRRTDVSELPIGVDFGHFQPGRAESLRQELGFNADDIVLIYSGTISPKRRLHILIAGFQMAQKQFANMHLVLVGEGADVTRLQSLVSAWNLERYVHFIGYVPYQEMPFYMQVADIGLGFVPMVPWFDKAPVLKTMEALAAGLPTIATATRGNQTYIQHEDTGLLVEDTPSALATAMLKLALNAELRERLGQGRDKIQQYDWNRIVNDVLFPTYQTLCEQKRLRRMG